MDKFCPFSIKKIVVHVGTHYMYITSQETPLMSTPLLCFKREMEIICQLSQHSHHIKATAFKCSYYSFKRFYYKIMCVLTSCVFSLISISEYCFVASLLL